MKYPPPEELPETARLDDYLTYMKSESVSDVIAAHLAYEIVPIFDSEYAFLHPFMEEAREIYKLLSAAAEENKIIGVKFESGKFKAPLINWIHFLMKIRHPLPDIVVKVYETTMNMMEKSSKYKNFNQKENGIDSSGIRLDKNREKLKNELIRLDDNFPKFPYKYYYFHPVIKSLLIGQNLDVNSFVSVASSLIQRSRPSGRPRREYVGIYAKAHPELKEWFDEIKSQLK